MSGAGKVDILVFSEATNSTHLHGVMPYAEFAAEYPTWTEPQKQLSNYKWRQAFEEKCGKLQKDGSTELPAAGARRIGFQMHMVLEDGSSFDDVLHAIIS